ncbi:MAG TPA: hypothetical protein VIY73_00590, partial [Polyangiaceae bacterium]
MTASVPMTAMLSATQGTPPYAFALVNPPSGWTIGTDGTIAGTPGPGLTMLSVLVTDASGGYDQQLFQVWGSDPAAATGIG